MSFSFDKVTTGTNNFVSFILKVAPDGATIAGGSLLFYASLVVISARIQFLDQDKINSTLQLINKIFKVLQKLLKYFKGITISASAESSSPDVFPIILVFYLKDSELVLRGLCGSSL